MKSPLNLNLLIAFVLCVSEMGNRALAAPFELNYSGRLTTPNHAPLAGPIDLRIRFFRSIDSTEPIDLLDSVDHSNAESDALVYNGLVLSSGLFSVQITLSDQDSQNVFNGELDVYVELTDLTNNPNAPYGRQRFYATPFSLKIPVDHDSLQFNSQGKLEVKQLSSEKISGELNKTQLPNDIAYLVSGKIETKELPADVSLLGQSIEGTEIAAKAVGFANLATSNCSNGQVIKFNSASDSFECGVDESGDNSSASNLSAGTLADARLSSNVALKDQSNNFTHATLEHQGNAVLNASMLGTGANQIIQLNGSSQLPAVDGSQLQNINAASVDANTITAGQIASGAVENSELANGAVSTTKLDTSLQNTINANTAKNSYPSADASKLSGIEAGADVTDATNVESAGAIMDADFSQNGFMKRTAAGTYETAQIESSEIADNTITADDIAANAITADQIDRAYLITNRNLPASNGDTVDIGTFTTTNGMIHLEVSIAIADDDSNSFTAFYRILSSFGENSGMHKVLPVKSAARSFDLEFGNTSASDFLLRVRRSSPTAGGAASPTLHIHIRELGKTITSFVAANNGPTTPAAVTDLETSSPLTQQNGKVGINADAPVAALQIDGSSEASLSGHGLAVIGNTGSLNTVIDADEIQARSNGSAAKLHLNYHGSNIQIGDNTNTSSDAYIEPPAWVGVSAFQNNWSNYGGPFSVAAYQKDKQHRVHLRGLVTGADAASCGTPYPSGPGAAIFTLPEGFRPHARLLFQVLVSTGSGRVDILPTGEVHVGEFGVCDHVWTSLEGISFHAQ